MPPISAHLQVELETDMDAPVLRDVVRPDKDHDVLVVCEELSPYFVNIERD